jgi:carbon storage regulator CsrA
MLVLSRKETDKIVFPTLGITVEVLRIRGNVARIGIDAPSEVPIYRHELTDRKHLEFSTDQDSSVIAAPVDSRRAPSFGHRSRVAEPIARAMRIRSQRPSSTHGAGRFPRTAVAGERGRRSHRDRRNVRRGRC